jgi:hypothetical protein
MDTPIHKIGKTVRGLLWMLALVILAIMFLAAVNWLPSLREEGFARQYNTIDEAKRALKLNDIVVPSYFPEGIRWPPSFILAQKKPYQAVVMEFNEVKSKEIALIVIQSSLLGSDAQLQRIKLSQVKEETQYRLKDRYVLLQVGTCDNGMQCSKMTWQDSGLFNTVVFMSSPFELIRIAESMIRS